MKPLHTDADGVILDLNSAYHRYMKEMHGHVAVVNEPSCYNFSDAYPYLDKPHMHILDFLESYDYFSSIQAYPEAKTALKALHDLGAPITVVTSCGQSDETRRGRLDCLDREFGRIINDVIILPLGSTKGNELRMLPEGVFIDDQFAVCEAVHKDTGHHVYMRNRRYNENESHPLLGSGCINRMACWSQLPYEGLRNTLSSPSNSKNTPERRSSEHRAPGLR